MPPYKLLVGFELRVSGTLAKLLTSQETARGTPTLMVLTFTNVGTERFPGGRVRKLAIYQAGPMAGMSKEAALDENESSIGALAPDESSKPISVPVALEWDGLARVELQIAAVDGQQIEHHQRRAFSTGNTWHAFFYSVVRENLQTVELLDRIAKTLERAEK